MEEEEEEEEKLGMDLSCLCALHRLTSACSQVALPVVFKKWSCFFKTICVFRYELLLGNICCVSVSFHGCL